MINTSCGFDAQRLSTPLAAHQVWTSGCVQALITLLEANIVPVSCALSGIAVLQVASYPQIFRLFLTVPPPAIDFREIKLSPTPVAAWQLVQHIV